MAKEHDQRSAGGADARFASYLERIYGGISEGVRWMFQMVIVRHDDDNNKISWRQGRPPTQIKMAVVGFGRTGSTSMYEALKQLGYTPLHDNERLETADLMGKLFHKDLTSRISVDTFATSLGDRGFDAIMYYGYGFIEWCVEHNVPVVLTVRDSPQKWAESWVSVVDLVDLFKSRPFIWSQSIQLLIPGFEHLLIDMTTDGKPDMYKDIDTLAAGYTKHLQTVRDMVPPHLLLEFNVKQGWEPLCQFLDKPVPNTPFPHVNDRVVMKAALTTFWLITWIWPLVPLAVLYLSMRVVKSLARSRRQEGKKTKNA